MSALQCWNCGAALTEVPLPISRHANCAACYAHLHCCRLCVNYDPRRPAQCTEDRAEPPGNKEAANFCEWFEPRGGAVAVRGTAAAAARARLDAMFALPAANDAPDQAPRVTISAADGAPTPPPTLSPADLARAELDRLFGVPKKPELPPD